MPISLGKTLRILREARGLPLRQVAVEAGVSVPYLSLLETERRSPSVDKLKALAEALDVPSDFLILVASGAKSSLSSGENTVARLFALLERLTVVQRELKNEIETKAD
jgi:transcriptional regulator with XRE-family HTH domain